MGPAKFSRLFAVWIAVGCGVFRADANEMDVPYGEADGQQLLLDVYSPESVASARPAVILVHGGGWRGGNKKLEKEFGEVLASKGYVAFAINYRLVTPAGGNRWPVPFDDCQRAVRWVRANAGKYKIDPSRVGALGTSAGGHLVACLGVKDTRDNSDPALAKYSSRVNCAVDMFGPTYMDYDFQPAGQEPPRMNADVIGLLGGTPEQVPKVARDASPLYDVDAKSAPFLILHGVKDNVVPVDQARRLDSALREAGIESRLMVLADQGHGFKPSLPEVEGDIESFFQRHLRP